MSFFDEADEPQPTPRAQPRRTRNAPRPRQQRSGRPPGGSGRPPGGQHQQEVQTRRLVAAAVIVVVVIVLALLIKSCDSSATNSALKNYNASVYNLINASDSTGSEVFSQLASGNLSGLSSSLAPQHLAATRQLDEARGLHPPSQMANAQTALVTVMQLRVDAITTIAFWAPQAANKSSSRDAVKNIALGTSYLWASDVMYKRFVVTGIAKALNGAGIPVGSSAGKQQINPGQIVPDLGWLQPSWIAQKIGAQESTSQANANNDQPGLTHGDQLNYVTVDGTQLSAGGTYTIPASAGQTWTLSVTNGGQTAENQVGCSVKVKAVNDAGTQTIPTIASGATTNCTVTLKSKPPAGPYSVTATVAKVPGEKNLQNNSATYTIDFN